MQVTLPYFDTLLGQVLFPSIAQKLVVRHFGAFKLSSDVRCKFEHISTGDIAVFRYLPAATFFDARSSQVDGMKIFKRFEQNFKLENCAGDISVFKYTPNLQALDVRDAKVTG